MEEENVETELEGATKPLKLSKLSTKSEIEPGIIYMSRIPTLMNVKKVREILGVYGEIGKIFLQPDEKAPAHKKNRSFKEGWVEFLDKRVAKRIAKTLNNTQVGGKRRSPWYFELWNFKYLPKFKWAHLNERLAYERAVHQQRLRTEIAQAKREANFYTQNVERSKVIKRLEKKRKKSGQDEDVKDAKGNASQEREWVFKQKDTEEEIESRKRRKLAQKSMKCKLKSGGKAGRPAPQTAKQKTQVNKAAANKTFLKNLFSGGVAQESDES